MYFIMAIILTRLFLIAGIATGAVGLSLVIGDYVWLKIRLEALSHINLCPNPASICPGVGFPFPDQYMIAGFVLVCIGIGCFVYYMLRVISDIEVQPR